MIFIMVSYLNLKRKHSYDNYRIEIIIIFVCGVLCFLDDLILIPNKQQI